MTFDIPNKKSIADEIRRIMTDKGIGVTDLARAIQKPRTTVYNIMDGNASYELLAKTMETLDKW